jgi:outer membrane protein TolC
MKTRFTALTALALIALPSSAGTIASAQAQEPGARADTLTLGRLHEAALRHDARAAQSALNESALELRLRSLASEWLPGIRVRGEARYQSDVTRIEASGASSDAPVPEFPEVPKDRYEAALGVEQVLYDGGSISGRREVERARTSETQAHLTTTLHELKREVDRAYFSAIALAARSDETALLIEDLEARLGEARSGVEAGVRLPGEAARIEAELLRARQRLAELHGDRRAAISVLSNLTGEPVGKETMFPLPMLEAEVAATRAEASVVPRRHPVFDAFRGTAERLAREAELAAKSADRGSSRSVKPATAVPA